jgi:hypothetical protein
MSATPYGPYEYEDGEPACPQCGAEAEWADCWGLGCEDGTYDASEDDPLWYGDDGRETCSICEGSGGWYYCPNGCEVEERAFKNRPVGATAPRGQDKG